MKKADVSVKRRKKFEKTTDSNHKLSVAPNLIERKFDGLVKSPNLDGFVKCSRSRLANPEE